MLKLFYLFDNFLVSIVLCKLNEEASIVRIAACAAWEMVVTALEALFVGLIVTLFAIGVCSGVTACWGWEFNTSLIARTGVIITLATSTPLLLLALLNFAYIFWGSRWLGGCESAKARAMSMYLSLRMRVPNQEEGE